MGRCWHAGAGRHGLWAPWVGLVLATALLLPFFGPSLDHHFAERQPGHLHLASGRVGPRHVHPYERAHGHTLERHGAAKEAQPLSGVAYLTSRDGAPPGVVPAGSPLGLLPLEVPDPSGLPRWALVSPGQRLYLDPFSSPPERPPNR